MAIPRFACLLTSALLAAACSSPVMASEAELCQAQNLGSAISAGACFDAQLRAAALKLVELEVSYASSVLSTSNNPPYAKRVLEAEAKQWRTYRAAKCELFGETEEAQTPGRMLGRLRVRSPNRTLELSPFAKRWPIDLRPKQPVSPNPSIERTPESQLRCLSVAAHVER